MTTENYTPPLFSSEPSVESAYCVFATQGEAVIGLQVIYSNMVAAIASPDLLDVTTEQVIPQEDLTEADRAEYGVNNRRFPIFGVNAATGVKNVEQGYTTAWAEARETTQGQWVFPEPGSEFLVGVTGYTVEPYDPNWFTSEPPGN